MAILSMLGRRVTVMENNRFMNPSDVAADFGISESKAYMIIKEMNDELKNLGYITVAGKVSKKYYLERTYGSGIFFDQQDIDKASIGGDTILILKTFEAVVNMLNMIKVVSKTVVKSDESSQIVATSEEWE